MITIINIYRFKLIEGITIMFINIIFKSYFQHYNNIDFRGVI